MGSEMCIRDRVYKRGGIWKVIIITLFVSFTSIRRTKLTRKMKTIAVIIIVGFIGQLSARKFFSSLKVGKCYSLTLYAESDHISIKLKACVISVDKKHIMIFSFRPIRGHLFEAQTLQRRKHFKMYQQSF